MRLQQKMAFLGVSALLFVLSCQVAFAETLTVVALGTPSFKQEPTYGNASSDVLLGRALFSSLMDIDRDLNAVNALAESVTRNRDLTVVTVTLRPELHFSDGVSLNAHDVLFTYQRLARSISSGAAIERGVLKSIKGYDDFLKNPSDVGKLGIKLIDDRTIQFDLDHPDPMFEHNTLASFSTGILPKHKIEKEGLNWMLVKPFVSSGGFVFERWESESALIAKKNQYFFKPSSPKDFSTLKIYFSDNKKSSARLMQEVNGDFVNLVNQEMVEIAQKTGIWEIAAKKGNRIERLNLLNTSKKL